MLPQKVYLASAVLIAALSAGRVHAQTVNGMPCTEFCQAWMNTSDADTSQTQAQPTSSTINIEVSPRAYSMINDYYSLTPACRSRGRVRVELSDMPRHGQLVSDLSQMHPRFEAGDRMAVCNHRRVGVTRVLYRPDPGFSQDDFTLSIQFPNGETSEETYHITIR